MIYNSVSELIGGTPMLQLKSNLLAKLEGMNPAGSVKDRVARNMIERAEREGRLSPGERIIEPTSGNTGIGLAAIAAAKGYKMTVVMPDSMSAERIMLMKAYGAEVVLTPGALGMNGAIEQAETLCRETPGSIIAGQFENPANPEAHYHTTGPEIWADTEGKADVFVAGVGTGGTLTGTGRYLKEKNPNIEIVAVEPTGSPVLSEGRAGAHGLQGIGAGFVPAVLDRAVIDRVVTVDEQQAYAAARDMAKTKGILVGISSGAALAAAMEISAAAGYEDKTVVVLLPDSGERYLSTDLFKE